jgi:putative metallohydrolase (TIGR04338 family)
MIRLMILGLVLICLVGADQTSTVYLSERVLMEQKSSRFLNSRREAEIYLNEVFNDVWFRNNFKINKPQVIRSERDNWAYSVLSNNGGRIAIPDKGCWNWNVLHEVAHHIVPKGEHGKDFINVELLLVEHFLNMKAANALRKSFKRNGLNF